MSPLVATLICFGLYFVGYRFYGRYIGRRAFALDDSRPTPAHEFEDGHDYVPTRKAVLFGHHYASIAGLAPMLGPAIAVIWGWVPAMIWVVLGTLFVGAVHDFSALCISIRAKGKSIGRIAEDIIGRRAKYLFHALIVFLIGLAMGVFVQVVAQLFSSVFYPEAVTPSTAVMVLAIAIGYLSYRKGVPLRYLVPVGAALLFGSIWLGMVLPAPDLSTTTWSFVLLAYAFCASVLPVWLLLQPRDFLNSILLYLGLIGIFISFVILNPEFAAPAYNPAPAGAPPIYPFVFIVIACGAVSGFHALVSSGTTSKQLDKESDAPFIGYGGMIGESLLGLSAVLATTAGFASREEWSQHFSSWNSANGLAEKLDAYITGAANFLTTLGIPVEAGKAFMALVAVSFALTTLDSATRILRYNIEEISESIKAPFLGNRHVASFLAVVIIGFFALMKVPGGPDGAMMPAGTALWALFGTTNQIMAGLTLLSVTLYLYFRKKPFAFALIPMVFMVVTTIAAMLYNIREYAASGNVLLLVVGGAIMALALGLVVEGILRVTKGREAAVEGIRRAFGD